MTRNGSAAFQIGNGAGNLERAIITTCAQPHFLSGLKHELLREVFHAEQCINISRAIETISDDLDITKNEQIEYFSLPSKPL